MFHPRSNNTHNTLNMRIVARGCQFALKIRIRCALRAPWMSHVWISSKRLTSNMYVLSENLHDPLCVMWTPYRRPLQLNSSRLRNKTFTNLVNNTGGFFFFFPFLGALFLGVFWIFISVGLFRLRGEEPPP